jgi:hypothetical protein
MSIMPVSEHLLLNTAEPLIYENLNNELEMSGDQAAQGIYNESDVLPERSLSYVEALVH